MVGQLGKEFREKMEDTGGQGLVSYALILLSIALVTVGSFSVFGNAVVEMFNKINTSFP
jgi:Flp pilus assembly pilin Flp